MGFKLALGVNVADLSGISEGFELSENERCTTIVINISRENLENVFLELAKLVVTPGFLILENPTHRDKEKELRENDHAPFHKDVHYLDDIGFEELLRVWERCSKWFLDDGAVTFGFGSHSGIDEVFIGRYKIAYIYTNTPQKYVEVLSRLGYSRRERLRTVWDNFSDENPGSTTALTIDGKRVYELVDELKPYGLYFSEHRES